MFSRRTLQVILGVFWVIAGLWQLQAKRFTKDFIFWCLAPQADFEPPWLSHSMDWMAKLLEPHIAVYNGFFVGISILIGIGLMINIRVKIALVVSFVFALFVWWFGEAFGQMFDGQSLIFSGAPGTAFLFGMMGIVVWPFKRGERWMSGSAQRIARFTLGTVLILGGLLQFQPVYLHQGAFVQVPSPFMFVFGRVISNDSITISIILAVLQLIVGIAIFIHWKTQISLGIAVVMSIVFWMPDPGRMFGNFLFPSIGGFTSDPSEGLLLILLSLSSFTRNGALNAPFPERLFRRTIE